uniref:Retrotransposon protein, putative, Ty3-gypsy subclass n=1 Tax=Oryza sativa subsp. japonica TaxID=39947 RepID=Q2QQG7_ORYSJ|nr:retrotransposon protein, putative, Ty3-gypsy subclass [Oryza sativa Japonica Group]
MGRSDRAIYSRSDWFPGNFSSHATPHVPNAYNDTNRGYPPDTRYGQYNYIAPQQPPLRPPNTPPNPYRPKNMEELISTIIRATFGVEAKDRARIPEFTKFSGEDSRTTWEHVDQLLAQCDSVPYPQGFEVPNFMKFTGEDARTTMEHIGQFIEQCGKAGSDDLLKLKLFPLSLSNFASTWYSLLAPSSISTWSQMDHEFHDYFKDASLMEQRPIDNSSVTCDTISVTPMPKTGIVSNSLPASPIDVDKKKGKSVFIGDPRPKNRIKNAKAEDHKIAKDESSSF